MLRRLGRHSVLAPVVVGSFSLLLSLGLSLVAPLPEPQFHDEFSYLLAGDTFAHGRLTNPPHPHWRSFETFQVLQTPTYASKYPPMQGLFLALGIVTTGQPIVGVWVSTALACGAACWALARMVPRRWAFVGGLLLALHPMILGWNWSYWGGAPAMIGGCLVVGALLDRTRGFGAIESIALGLGIGILLNSRPFEGAILTLACVTISLIRTRGRKSVVRLPSIVPGAVVLLAIIGWTAYYNQRVTGSATLLPYMLYENQYAATSPLIFLPAPATQPVYSNPTLRDYYLGWELPQFTRQRTFGGFISLMGEKTWSLLSALFASPLLAVPALAGLLAVRRDRRLRIAWLASVVCIAVGFTGLWFFPHYIAPLVGVFALLLVQGIRYLAARLGRRIVIRLLLLTHVLAAFVWVESTLPDKILPWSFHRAQIINTMEAEGGKYLIFVRYVDVPYAHNEWVYNDADVDAATVVWARDLGDEPNRMLTQYYRDRQVWWLIVTSTGARLVDQATATREP